MLSFGPTSSSQRNQVSCDSRKSAFSPRQALISSGWQLWTSGRGCNREGTWEEVLGMWGSVCDFYKLNLSVTVENNCVAWGGSKGSRGHCNSMWTEYPSLTVYFLNSFRLEFASCWDLHLSVCVEVSTLIALSSGLGECLMLVCAWMLIKECRWLCDGNTDTEHTFYDVLWVLFLY